MRLMRRMRSIHRRGAALVHAALFAAAGVTGCGVGDKDRKDMAAVFAGEGGRPDELPVMVNKQPPFRYPTAAYAQKIQGNTTLRIYIDQNGNVAADSTKVAEPSGNPSLDSAAVVGARELKFVPAKRNGKAEAISILFPVYWRHPDAPPLPGDTILNRGRTP